MKLKGPVGFGRVMNIGMNACMCSAFSLIMLWVAQQGVPEGIEVLTPTSYFISVVTAFGIGYVTVDLIPVFEIGNGFAKKLGLKGVAGYVATVFAISIIVTTIIGFLMTLINMLDRKPLMDIFMTWLGMYPIMLIVGFVIQLIIMKPFMLLAKRISGFDPDNPSLSEPPL